jgi:hypothetical protein
VPRLSGNQALSRRSGPRSCANVAPLIKELRKSNRIVRWVPPPALREAQYQLAGELGIVAVLSEGKRWVGALAGPAAPKPLLDVLTGDVRRLGFDDESDGITECLAKERAGELF